MMRRAILFFALGMASFLRLFCCLRLTILSVLKPLRITGSSESVQRIEAQTEKESCLLRGNSASLRKREVYRFIGYLVVAVASGHQFAIDGTSWQQH